MRITFLLTQSLESPGGNGRFMPLAKYLARLGHQVTIIALHHDYSHLKQKKFIRDNVTVWYVGQMHVRKFGDHKLYYGPIALLFITIISTIRLTIAALRTPSDIIQICKAHPMNGIAGWIVHILHRVPAYLDSDDYEAVNNRFNGKWQQWIVSWFENWIPSFVEGITVNTTFMLKQFQKSGYPTERIRLVPNGVDHERFALLDSADFPDRIFELRQSLGIKKRDRVIVYIGSMSMTSHAIDLLLEAFAEVIEFEPDALLLLVGGGEDIEQLKALSESLKISTRVKFIGRVSGNEIPLYYRLGEVSVDPRPDSLSARSSLSLKLVESIVAGVPCVTTNIGDMGTVIGEVGVAVPPSDPKALAKAILSILTDSEAATYMRASAQYVRSTHFWKNKVNLFANIYTETKEGKK